MKSFSRKVTVANTLRCLNAGSHMNFFSQWCGWAMWLTMFIYITAGTLRTFHLSFPFLTYGVPSYTSNFIFNFFFCILHIKESCECSLSVPWIEIFLWEFGRDSAVPVIYLKIQSKYQLYDVVFYRYFANQFACGETPRKRGCSTWQETWIVMLIWSETFDFVITLLLLIVYF